MPRKRRQPEPDNRDHALMIAEHANAILALAGGGKADDEELYLRPSEMARLLPFKDMGERARLSRVERMLDASAAFLDVRRFGKGRRMHVRDWLRLCRVLANGAVVNGRDSLDPFERALSIEEAKRRARSEKAAGREDDEERVGANVLLPPRSQDHSAEQTESRERANAFSPRRCHSGTVGK